MYVQQYIPATPPLPPILLKTLGLSQHPIHPFPSITTWITLAIDGRGERAGAGWGEGGGLNK